MDAAGHDATVTDDLRTPRWAGRPLWKGRIGAIPLGIRLDLLPRIHPMGSWNRRKRWIAGQ